MALFLSLTFLLSFVLVFQLGEAELAALHERYGLRGTTVSETLRALGSPSKPTWRQVWELVVVPLFAHQFVHAGAIPALVNALFLWLFGGRIESRIGSWRFLVFHVAAGVLTGVAHVAVGDHADAVVVGAGGAVAASLGAYPFVAWGSRIRLLVPVVVVPVFVELSAVIVILVWFALHDRPLEELLAIGVGKPHSYVTLLLGLFLGMVLLPVVRIGRPSPKRPRGGRR